MTDDRRAVDPCVALWRAILAQAIKDATEGREPDRLAAQRWLWFPTRDFAEVCINAELDPAWVRARITALAERTPDWRKWTAAPMPRPVKRGYDGKPIPAQKAA